MVDEEYVRVLLDILTNPAPSGIDPADPYGQADDGIDRYDGFSRDVTVTGLRIVEGPHGDELEVGFAWALPPEPDPEWVGVPEHGVARVPFDEEWRRLSGFTEPADYAPHVAARVMRAAGDHVQEHRHGERMARTRAEWRARAQAALPDRATRRKQVLDALAGEGEVTQVAPDRIELRLPDATDEAVRDAAGSREEVSALNSQPEVITFVLSPEEWEEVLIGQYDDDLSLYIAETLALPDPDEQFVVLYEGDLRLSTRMELPPVRGRAWERALSRLRAEHPPGPGYGWSAADTNDSSDPAG